MARGESSRNPQPQAPLPPRSRSFKCNFLCRIQFSLFLCIVGVAFIPFLATFFLSDPPLERLEDFSGEFLRNDDDLSFVEYAKFEPYKCLDKFRLENAKFYRLRSVKLKHCLVCTDLLVNPYQDLMISLALSLKEIGHDEFEVPTLEDGPVISVRRQEGISVKSIETNGNLKVDWLNYNAVFLNSLEEARDIQSCLMQEPFKSVPVIWTVGEGALATRMKKYNSTGQKMVVDSWRKVLRRANAVMFYQPVQINIITCFCTCWNSSLLLYQGLGLSSKGRRLEFDAPYRLRLLRDPYYRDVLGEYGGFFAIANRTWRATARKESLSKIAEKSLLEAIETHRYGDAGLFFWAPMDKDPRNPQRQDFWSFCDDINAGNCQDGLSSKAAMKQQNLSWWSVMHSWGLIPTRYLLEFAIAIHR